MKTPYGDVTLKAVKELRSKDSDVEIRKAYRISEKSILSKLKIAVI